MAKVERWENRDAQCPSRGPNLTHIQNGTAECVFCGVLTEAVEDEVERPTPKRRSRKKKIEWEFTDDEIRKLEFLRHLRRTGRI